MERRELLKLVAQEAKARRVPADTRGGRLAHHLPKPCGKARSTKGIRRLIWNNFSRCPNR